MRVRILNQEAFRRALHKAALEMRVSASGVAGRTIGEAMAIVSTTVPSDSGRLSAAYGDAARQLGVEGGNTRGGVPGDAEVRVTENTVVVAIHLPHALAVELGTEHNPPGLQVTTAMEHIRRKLTYGRGPNSLRGQLAAAFQANIPNGS